MRVSPKRRRRWNNILIAGITFFIVIINAPTLIKAYLLDDQSSTQIESINGYPSLLNSNAQLLAIQLSDNSLEWQKGAWVSTRELSISPQEWAQRWQSLLGTQLDDATMQKLAPQLIEPETIEVWYQNQEEPQRITFYRLADFWVFKNWQDQWIAISVSTDYLFPY
ncbi:hypothetical protein QO227_11520 [Vibrio vulnificus]|uniref:hypothetical protein n=1 Tax=Vibrio vulnificus TaxID=672 RepID=UPI0024DFDCC7|nr:hypothetical protein [Vibrio vulnificus]MDK2603601.1 hypothetical protein [Vibrio vulnificus]MDK2624391.1 hypothetical protein [Vibrio vulnificus]MDK2642390.1 hypothetical protein [Vibrio vulnificus]MDK2668804.1 hypothetical protein [Vibrio vulnificus]MDK2719686.1 hypothetical protein [Vibrio vulnificus]